MDGGKRRTARSTGAETERKKERRAVGGGARRRDHRVEHVERQTFYRGNIDGVIVTARRLGEDGQFDVDGERIRFMMSCPVGRLIPEVERVGRVTEQAVQLSYVIQRF